MFEKGAKICFFSSTHISDSSLNYRFLEDNSIENVNYSNMLNDNTKLENLMKERANHIKLKFDLIFQQFGEAREEVLKNSAEGEEEDVSFDDLFG